MPSKIILAPYSARLHTGNRNPKNYPHWFEVVGRLNALGYEVIQIGITGEERVEGVSRYFVNWPFPALRLLLEDADCFLTVDSFLPHFVYAEKLNIRGVVVWGQSDPLIWGHPTNINLLKSREFLREFQFQNWTTNVEYNADAFVSPEEVVNAVTSLACSEPPDRRRLVPRILQLEESPQKEPAVI